MKKDAERKARYRQNIALAHAQHIQSEPPQPPPWGDVNAEHAPSRNEIATYRARYDRWAERHAGYDSGWHRPGKATVEAIYARLEAGLPFPLKRIHADPLVAKQLLAIALDAAVVAGRYGRRRRNTSRQPRLRQVRRRLTRTRFFDVIARYFSPTYRQARDEGRAFSVFQMTEATIRAVRRDLILEGISVPRLWKLVTGTWPTWQPGNVLFHVVRSKRLHEGYRVVLHRTNTRRQFELLVQRDRAYAPTRVGDVWRLWVDDTPRPDTAPHPSIVAEQPYNKIVIPPESASSEILALQERTRLLFDPVMFVSDYDEQRAHRKKLGQQLGQYPKGTPRAEQSQEERDLRRAYHRTKAMLLEYRFVYEQAKRLPPAPVVIRSGFSKALNRRFQPEHFWLMEAGGKAWAERTVLREPIGYEQVAEEEFSAILDPHAPKTIRVTQRDSWFMALPPKDDDVFTVDDLVHVDVSSSQTQLQAVFCGIEALEQIALADQVPLKETLARLAWEHRHRILRDGYTERDLQPGGRLLDACKNLWMRVGYGSPVQRVVLDQRDHVDTYGPGWTNSRDVALWLATLPGFTDMAEFLDLCRFIGEHAPLYEGVTLADPLCGTLYAWNPIARVDVPLRFNQWMLTAIVPGVHNENTVCPACQSRYTVERDGETVTRQRTKTRQLDTWWCGHPFDKERPCKASWPAELLRAEACNGRWPVDREKLRKMIAPCLTHSLDSLFAACVMRELAAKGIRNFASVHDSWFMAALVADHEGGSYGLDVLTGAVHAAGRPWLESLGPLYGSLADALEASTSTIQQMPDRSEWRVLEGTAERYRDLIAKMRGKWLDRRRRQDWPQFFAVGGDTLRWDRRPRDRTIA